MPPLRPISTLRKPHLSDVVPRAEHQRFIDGFALVGQILVLIAGARIDVNQNQILFERCAPKRSPSRCVHGEAAAVENQLVVAADLIHVDDRDLDSGARERRTFPAEALVCPCDTAKH